MLHVLLSMDDYQTSRFHEKPSKIISLRSLKNLFLFWPGKKKWFKFFFFFFLQLFME